LFWALFVLLFFFIGEGFQELHGERKDDRRILFRGNFRQRAQEPELKSLRICGNDVCGLKEFIGGLEFAFGVDDLGSAFPFGLGLLGDGPDHVLRKVHLFHLHELDLDAPGVGVLLDDGLEAGVQFIPLRKEVVERNLAEDAAQGRLGQLGGGVEIILHIKHALERVDDPEVENGVDLHRNIVLRNDILGGDGHRDEPEADSHDTVDRGEDQDDARPFGFRQDAAESENDAAFIFPENFYGTQQIENKKAENDHRIRNHIALLETNALMGR